jgi:hypothetical protein
MKYAMTYDVVGIIFIEELPYKRYLSAVLIRKCTYLHGIVILRFSVW